MVGRHKMKRCPSCFEIKPKEEFYKNVRSYDGLTTYCAECTKLRMKKAYARDKEKIDNRKKKYRLNNIDAVKSRDKRRYEAKREEILAQKKEYYKENKSKYREHSYSRAKMIVVRSFTHERPDLNNFYLNCPPGHHVDHVVPLKHPLVCGLHVMANLQYLPARENDSKGNKFEVL